MRYIEYRRHTKRQRLQSHIIQKGVDLARKVGKKMGKFDQVITSTSPRAYETAIAMGYAVNNTCQELSDIDNKALMEVDYYDGNFRDFAENVASSEELKLFLEKQVKLLIKIAESLGEKGKALIIGHGLLMESTIVRCLPNETNYKNWGKRLRLCEGVRLYYDDGKFIKGEVIRIDKKALLGKW